MNIIIHKHILHFTLQKLHRVGLCGVTLNLEFKMQLDCFEYKIIIYCGLSKTE